MKFKVSKTSEYCSDNKPIDEAKIEQAVKIDVRTCKSFTEVKKQNWGSQWFADGKNHRVEGGFVKRDMPERSIWTIRITNLKQLLGLVDKYGEIIIEPIEDTMGYKYEIEIYDDYRESL